MQDYILRPIDINGNILPFSVKQYDNNSRRINLSIIDVDNPDEQIVNLQNHTVRAYFRLPDGSIEFIDGEVVDSDDGRIAITIPGSVTQLVGTVECEIKISGADDNTLLSLRTFKFTIDPSFPDDNVTNATDKFSALTKALKTVDKLETRMDNLTAMADAGEIPAGTIESEVIDMRMGADGMTYESAGAAVRGQVEQLNMQNVCKADLPYTLESVGNKESGLIGINGELYSSGNHIELSVNAGEMYSVSGCSFSANDVFPLYYFKKSDGTAFGAFGESSTYYTDKKVLIPDGAVTMVVHGDSATPVYAAKHICIELETYIGQEINNVKQELNSVINDGLTKKLSIPTEKSKIEIDYIQNNFFKQVNGATYTGDTSKGYYPYQSMQYELDGQTQIYVSGTNYNSYFPIAVFVDADGTVTGYKDTGNENTFEEDVLIDVPEGSAAVYVNIFYTHANGYGYIPAYYYIQNILSDDVMGIVDMAVDKKTSTTLSNLDHGKKFVCFGDSITQGIGALNHPYTETFANILGANVINAGIGGSKYKGDSESGFFRIANYIVNNDFDALNAYIDNMVASNPSYTELKENILEMESTDFNTVDGIILAYGTNDWNSGTTLDDENNLYNTSTVLGAMRYGIKTLLTAFPHLRVYVFTPCYRDMLGENKDQTSDTYRNPTTNLLLSEVGNAIEQAAKSMGIPCKNMYYCSNLNEYTRDAYMSDGTHRNAAGYELLGKQYAKFVLVN